MAIQLTPAIPTATRSPGRLRSDSRTERTAMIHWYYLTRVESRMASRTTTKPEGAHMRKYTIFHAAFPSELEWASPEVEGQLPFRCLHISLGRREMRTTFSLGRLFTRRPRIFPNLTWIYKLAGFSVNIIRQFRSQAAICRNGAKPMLRRIRTRTRTRGWPPEKE